MHSSVVREFVSNIKTSDVFVGDKKLVAQSRFRPSADSRQGDILATNKCRDPSVLWVIGLVSSSDRELVMKLDGSFKPEFANDPTEAVRDACFRLVLVDPEDDLISPVFRSAVAGIKGIQNLYKGPSAPLGI